MQSFSTVMASRLKSLKPSFSKASRTCSAEIVFLLFWLQISLASELSRWMNSSKKNIINRISCEWRLPGPTCAAVQNQFSGLVGHTNIWNLRQRDELQDELFRKKYFTISLIILLIDARGRLSSSSSDPGGGHNSSSSEFIIIWILL